MITYDQIVVAAKQRLRIRDTSEYDALLQSWIYDGVRAARWPTTKAIKNCRITIEDNMGELPSDYSKFIAMQIDCVPVLYVQEDFFGGCTTCSPLGHVGQIVDGSIMLNSAIDTEFVDLAYWSLNTDSDGFLVLHDEDELALTYFLCKEFAITYSELYNKVQIQEWKEGFILEANNARGIKNRDQFNKDIEQLAHLMNSMLDRNGNISGLTTRLRGLG